MTARLESRAHDGRRPPVPFSDALRAEPPIPTRYVLIPDTLIATFAHDPLAVGVYVGIARLSLVAKEAVPLAARDLVAWMGSDRDADRAAVMRRIVKLVEAGWLLVTRNAAMKHRLLPTWGRDQAGTARPWSFDAADTGRPAHVRGRRVPLALLDDYLGRLDPHPGLGRALISRYFTQPLLDLADIGVYTIGLRAEILPTSRLRQLGLHGAAGMLVPPGTQSLLKLAAARELTTHDGEAIVPIFLSVHGYARLGLAAPTATMTDHINNEQVYGSMCGSADGSSGGSRDWPGETSASAHQDGQNSGSETSALMIAWDVGMIHESTKHDSAPDHALVAGGGTAALARSIAGSRARIHGSTTLTDCQLPSLSDEPTLLVSSLLAVVVEGHCALNPTRPIPAGEWYELLALQEAYGTEQLLIWQARASRAATERPHGITPAYYRACAAQDACERYRPSLASTTSAPAPRAPLPLPRPLDPACDALLHAMGVRERQKLADVPYDLIAAWQTAVGHPGMAAQFTTPIGFAVAQMQRGNAPPPNVELDRWAERAHRKADRYESWRHINAPPIAINALAHEQQLEARVRALAPPDTDLADLCELARAIEAGATDLEILARLQAKREEERR